MTSGQCMCPVVTDPRGAVTQAPVKALAVAAGQFSLAKALQTGPISCAGARVKEELELQFAEERASPSASPLPVCSRSMPWRCYENSLP